MIDPFVDVSWLKAHPDVVIVDARAYLDGRSGRDAWSAGHIPGAVYVSLDSDLAGPPSPAAGRHPLPSPASFAAAMGAVGIGDDDLVVAYDDAGGVMAARLVWMLRVLGHDAALLDGGLAAWNGSLTIGAETRPGAVFAAQPWPADRLASIDEVAGGGEFTLLDARDGARYRGETEPIDPRAGHIPGAVNRPAREWTDSAGRLLPDAALRERLGDVGDAVVSSCGSGVTACHTLLVLEHLGRPPGRLFPGSFSQWSSDPTREVAASSSP